MQKEKKSPCSKCVCADSSIEKLLKPAECFKSCWKKHHFHLIVYIYGGVFISFTDAHSCHFSRTPPWLHGARAVPEICSTSLCSSAIWKLPKFPQRDKGDSNTQRRGKRTVSQGWECHCWYDLSLDSSKQQFFAAATISTGKGDQRTCLFLGASRIRSLERLREGSVRELSALSIIRNAALQLPAICTHTQIKLN